MCGRYVLYGPDASIIEGFSVLELLPFVPRYNIAEPVQLPSADS